ncbi:PREDICTED: gastrula zinc finger protein XlCGF57.1-like [Papilio xuthus]|uniref:Gastrula zinc finger protein XlCGF57.1-like n=1 Tax=Papilio xuthus TaxID=66420 RepID=A0AAJ7EFW7_PAPXU|nr:PREDICTED: gastrula zinc finger protein XlCGF57.1-like [Papilio xuthus]
MDIPIEIDKPDLVCRVCLCKGVNMKLLTSKIESDDRTIAESLSFILNLYISESDAYAKQVCEDCYAVILKFDQFKKRCIQSEGSLDDAYYAESNVNIPISQDNKSAKEVSITKFCMDEPYQCSVCTKKFSDLLLLESHVLTGHSFANDQLMKDVNLTEAITQDSDYPTNTSPYDNSVENDNDIEFKPKDEINEGFGFADSTGDLQCSMLDCNAKDEAEVTEQVKTSNVLYKCKCEAIFDNCDQYKEHLHKKICKETFNTVRPTRARKVKEKKNDEKVEYVCPKCNVKFISVKRYKMHLRMHQTENMHPADKFSCSFCLRRFNYKHSYTAHMKTHKVKEGVKFICNTCKREFQHQAHLDNHILSVHTREKGFKCEYCAKNFSTQESLDNHREAHKVEKRHQCPMCNKAFYVLSTLKDHIRTHTGEKPFLCSDCGKGFSQKNNLTQHMRRHQGLKLFKCENCEQRFVSKGELVAHNRKHSGAHPFVCDECGNSFTTSSSLSKHRRIHTGEKPYACDLCDMKFTASGTLKNHRRRHTGEKPYQCSHCEKAFAQRQDLVSHIRCHTGERPFVCSTCGQAFRKATALKAHLKMHEKDTIFLQKDVTLSIIHNANALIT